MMNNVSSSVKITHENGNAFTDRCNELSETDKIVASLRAEYDEKLLNKSLEIKQAQKLADYYHSCWKSASSHSVEGSNATIKTVDSLRMRCTQLEGMLVCEREKNDALSKANILLRARIKELETMLAKTQAYMDDWMSENSLRHENMDLKTRIYDLEAQLKESQDHVAKLKAQLNRDHENSSLPSSKERKKKKINNGRKKTGRRPGGQPGHKGHKRPHLEPTEIEYIPLPDKVADHPERYYLTGKIITKQVIDIEVKTTVREYRTPEYRDRVTGTKAHAAFPEGVVNECNYGENVKAMAFLLNNYCNVSIDKTRELIDGITGGYITPSKGMINTLPRYFSASTAEEREKIFTMLRSAPTMYTDATGGRVNGKNCHVFVCANDSEIMYLFREHKGFKGVEGTPADGYTMTLIHDHDKTFYHYAHDHQECLSHVLRYLQDSIDNEQHLTWNTKMKEFISSMIHNTKDRRDCLSEEEIAAYEKQYDEILEIGAKEYLDHPPKGKYAYVDGRNLNTRLREYKQSHLYFLRHPEVDYTNNLSERSLRLFKRKQHQVMTFRSPISLSHLCDCMTIIETGKLRGANIFEIAKSGFIPV